MFNAPAPYENNWLTAEQMDDKGKLKEGLLAVHKAGSPYMYVYAIDHNSAKAHLGWFSTNTGQFQRDLLPLSHLLFREM